MKKTLKAILLYSVLFVTLVILIEAVTYCFQSARLIKEGYTFYDDAMIPPYPIKIKTFSNYYERRKLDENFCSVYGKNFKGTPILLFGDVYANGSDAPEEKSFAKKLSDAAQRPVYNYAHAGWGLQHMYYLIKNEENLSNIKEPETIVFVYNPYQIERLTSFSFYPHHNFLNLKYKLIGDAVVEQIPRMLLLYNSYFYRSVEMIVGKNKFNSQNIKVKKNLLNLIKKLFENSKKIAELRYPTIKHFVILRYVDPYLSLDSLKENGASNKIADEASKMWTELENQGFIIIDVTDLSDLDLNDGEYKYEDSSPNEEALNAVITPFVEKAKLKYDILTTKPVSVNLKKKRK